MWKAKGDPTDPATYRPISVMHPMAKLYSLALLRRTDALAESSGWHAREQAGFRRGYRLEDHQLLLTYLLTTAAVDRAPLALGFIDLAQAYDKVPRHKLWLVLGQELGVPPDLLWGLWALYQDTMQQVKVGPSLSAAYPVNTGVKQGCPASPLLFTLFFDRVSSWLRNPEGNRLRTRCPILTTLSVCLLMYADDVVLLAPGPARLQSLLTRFGNFCD